ncbi:MAG: formylglycine-generating enzyme family protein, partial [Blastocatellia bacterium]
YDGNYYGELHKQGVVFDPQGPDRGSYRVIRGGGWINDAVFCRSAIRSNADPGDRDDFVGLRLVRIGP